MTTTGCQSGCTGDHRQYVVTLRNHDARASLTFVLVTRISVFLANITRDRINMGVSVRNTLPSPKPALERSPEHRNRPPDPPDHPQGR